ncbi:MAG: AI-2E family transporter [Candidatus Omnitrophota bacterium]|jgi:predicted PurR-regulated permease PerM
MTKEQFVSVSLIALLLFIIHQIFQIFAPFMHALFWSAILAFAFFPLYVAIRKLLGRHDTLAALVGTLLIYLIVLPPLVILIVNITTQAIELYQLASQYVRDGNPEKLIEQFRALSFVQKIEMHLGEWDLLKTNLNQWLLTSAKTVANVAASKVGVLTKNSFLVILNLLLMMVLTFVFLKDGEKMYNFIYQIAPMEEKNKESVFRQICDTFSAVIRGQVLTALTQGLLTGLTFWALRLPLPIFFGMVTSLTAMIPVLGASIIWGAFVIYLVIIKVYTKAIILFVLGFFVISMIDNIMKPAIIGEKTKLPYFLLFFGILGGLKLYGVMGLFVAPVVLSLFFALVKIYRQKFV